MLRRLTYITIIIAGFHTLPSASLFADEYENEWENVSNQKAANQNSNEEEFESEVEMRKVNRNQAREADEMQQSSSKQVRRFHEVLDELLAEFGYDVRMGQLNGLKNVSIRRVDVSDALPRSYNTYIEMLVSERIRENSRVRLVTCVPCRTKTSHLVEGKLMITSPTTNMDAMRDAAKQLGIDQFMDIVLVYHTTHMVLAMQVFNTNTQELVWTRAYNSETIKTRYQKLAVDYQQVEKARPGEDYNPEYRFLVGLGGGIISNVNNESRDNGMISLMLRGTEKFDNRKHEFGLHTSMYMRKDALLGSGSSNMAASDSDGYSLATKKKSSELDPWSFAISMYGMYARHFVGNLESYNEIRHGANIGVGFLAAPRYLTTAVRVGWDIYFGKRFVSNLSGILLAPSTVADKEGSVKTKGGGGVEFTISVNL